MPTGQTPAHPEWHPGEEEMHRLLHLPPGGNPTIPGLPAAYAQWMSQSPLVALGTMDDQRRIWTTVLGGGAGVMRPIAAGVLGVSSPAHLTPRSADGAAGWRGLDPVLNALFAPEPDPHEGAPPRLVSGLAIDLEDRTRVKLAGRLLKTLVREGPQFMPSPVQSRVDVQLALGIDESLGNCPKYLNRKVIRAHEATPVLISESLPLPPEAVDLISAADIFFLSSRHGDESMDTNNRGGAPGFVRVFSNSDEEGVTLVYPEYSGNRLLQTLGNLKADPAVGITFPDFETGDILYLTGLAEILVGDDASTVLPHSNLAVRIRVDAARYVRDGLFFRGTPLDPSPYNPPPRRLAREKGSSETTATGITPSSRRPMGIARATVVSRRAITPTVSRYTLRLSPEPSDARWPNSVPEQPSWAAGQHITLDFSGELDQGWSHMRDHDPASLNDDYIRSFTITSPPPTRSAPLPDDDDENSMAWSHDAEITVREHGPVTRHLARWQPGRDLNATVLGFGGETDALHLDDAGRRDDIVVIAAGVGITPLLAQASPALKSEHRIAVLWTLKADDLLFAVDTLGQNDGLAAITTVFATGEIDASHRAALEQLERAGARVFERRMHAADVLSQGRKGVRRFDVCVGAGLRNTLLEWLDDEKVTVRSFDF